MGWATLNVVDDSLTGRNNKFQGGKLCRPVIGRVHQGFMRSFSWLWYGTEPVFSAEPVNRPTAIISVLKYALLFFGPLMAVLIAKTFGILTKPDNASIAAVCLFVAMIVVLTEKGIIEGLFTKSDPPDGTPISELLFKLNQRKQVVFTGHSLGGAIATLMFAIYRSWCSNDLSRRDNGHLVTFGSARVGDECFVDSFERNHGERMLHFEHPGDPVPQIPPNGLIELVTRRYIIRGPAGFIISLLFVPWTAFRVIYTTRPKRWSEAYVDTMGERPLRRLCFTFHSMTKFYLSHTQEALKRHTVDANHSIKRTASGLRLPSAPHANVRRNQKARGAGFKRRGALARFGSRLQSVYAKGERPEPVKSAAAVGIHFALWKQVSNKTPPSIRSNHRATSATRRGKWSSQAEAPAKRVLEQAK